ncbi:hypothetical protein METBISCDRAFT_28847, partial [Metschnikowia bicuspidata]
KPLPWVLEADDTDERNKQVIKNLIDFFFEQPNYRYFLSRYESLRFVDSHAFTLDDGSDGDDGLLLLHMILVLAVRRLSPVRYNLIGITDVPVTAEEMHFRSYILCAEYHFADQQ